MLIVPHNQPFTRFFPNVSPGYKIIDNSHNPPYHPITTDTIHSITILLEDYNGDELNLR